MLTKSEQRWLKQRENPCVRCEHSAEVFKGLRCGLRRTCKEQGYPLGAHFAIITTNLQDVAEFEAKAKLALLHIDNEDVPCANGMGLFCPARHFKGKGCGDWCRLRMAHLQAEEEMDK